MNWLNWLYAAWPFIGLAMHQLSIRRMDKRHTAALKKMQTALWNDRQLRIGRTPSTNSGQTIPMKVDSDV